MGETLELTCAARAPHVRVNDMSRKDYIKSITEVVMAVFGLSHTRNSKVGNEFIRGVSGVERKRVSISEMMLAESPTACWDNSTRGLDAATALEFAKALQISSRVAGISHTVAIYQASQAIYEVFNKVSALDDGRQIFFGSTKIAKRFFEEMGWYSSPRQTTADFLTSVTNPRGRKAREGYEKKVPRTAEEFQRYWKQSPEFASLREGMHRSQSEVL